MTKTNGAPSGGRRDDGSVVRDAVDPSRLVRDPRPRRKPHRDRVVDLLRSENGEDLSAQPSGDSTAVVCSACSVRARSAGGDEVLQARHLGPAKSSIPRVTVLASAPTSVRTSPTASGPTASTTRLVARLLDRTMAREHSQRSATSEPRRRQGSGSLSSSRSSVERGAVAAGPEVVVHPRRGVQIQTAGLRLVDTPP